MTWPNSRRDDGCGAVFGIGVVPLVAGLDNALGLGVLAWIIGFFVWALISATIQTWRESARKQAARDETAHADAQRQEQQRQWNSPEAVEQRRLEAERDRAEAEAHERRREAKEELRARQKWVQYHAYMRIEEVDGMDGRQFERFIKTLFERLDHKNVRETPASGDQGGDLVCDSPDNKKTVVQAKRWQGRVGNSAIMEVLGAMLYYKAEGAFVTTNSTFTKAARDLARLDPRIHLVDRTELAEMIRRVFPREVPEFDREKYDQFVKDWQPFQPEAPATPNTVGRSGHHTGRRGRHRRRRRW
jgi:restriction endonuclease Mrr